MSIQLTYCLENITGGDLNKLSQSRADLDVLCQKVSPKMVFSTANSHREIGNGYRAEKGFIPKGIGPQGRKPSMLCGAGETALLLTYFSAVRFPYCGYTWEFPHGQVLAKAMPCLPVVCLS